MDIIVVRGQDNSKHYIPICQIAGISEVLHPESKKVEGVQIRVAGGGGVVTDLSPDRLLNALGVAAGNLTDLTG